MHQRNCLPYSRQRTFINRMEHGATVFTDDERNLIVNYNYKLDDMEKTRELAEKLCIHDRKNQPVNEALTVIDAQAEIDALPDGRIGLSEMHEYGYSWNEMLPLTKDKATELSGKMWLCISSMRTVPKRSLKIWKN